MAQSAKSIFEYLMAKEKIVNRYFDALEKNLSLLASMEPSRQFDDMAQTILSSLEGIRATLRK